MKENIFLKRKQLVQKSHKHMQGRAALKGRASKQAKV